METHNPHHIWLFPMKVRKEPSTAFLVYRPVPYSINISGLDHNRRKNTQTRRNTKPPETTDINKIIACCCQCLAFQMKLKVVKKIHNFVGNALIVAYLCCLDCFFDS